MYCGSVRQPRFCLLIFSSLGGALAQLLAYEIVTKGFIVDLVNPNVDKDGTTAVLEKPPLGK